jgi:outer membrane murein-binding lipoprotein Lpp
MSDERETTELIAKNFLLTFEVSIKDLEAAEALFESGGLAPLRRPRSPLSKWRKDSATDETPVPSYQCPIERTSAFLRKATVGEMQDLDLLLPPCTSRASMKSALLAARWTIAARHSRATTVNSDDTFMLAAARSTSSAEATRQPEVSTTLQTWEELNTQWRSTVATAIFDLKTSASCRESSPLVTQLCAQISQLSTTCGTLTSALHELEMAHNTTKASYQHFLQSHVQNTETLVALNDKRDVQVAELTQQLSSRHPDLWAQVEQLKAELDASNAARYTLGREVDELRVELCARLQDVMRLTKVVNEHGEQAGVVLKEMSTLRDQNQKMRSTEELLRQRIASEKAQRLKAVQLLSGRLSGSGELLSPSKRDSIKGEQTVV